MDKSLKDKAIQIQGKDYVLVADRVKYFNDNYTTGYIQTKLVSPYDSDTIVVKAKVVPDSDKPERAFVDYAQELVGSSFINKTSAMENASTSAIGRALGLMGIGVLESIASADEVNKAKNRDSGLSKSATAKQVDWMRGEAQKVTGLDNSVELDKWIEDVLTIPPQKVPVYKVKDAVDKIKEIGSKVREENTETIIDLSDEEADKAIDDLKTGKIPY